MRYFLLLILNTIVVGGAYFYAVNELQIGYIMAVYAVVAVLSLCLYFFLVMRHNNELGKAKMQGKELPREVIQKRKRTIKLVMVCFFPFIFTVLADFVYLYLFVDNPMVESILKLFKQK